MSASVTARWNPGGRAILLLAAGTLALAFGQGHWPSPIGSVIGVALVARFMRAAPALPALALFLVAHVLVWEWAYRGMVPLDTAPRLGMEAGVTLVLAVVLLVDRRVSNGTRSFATTLVLPAGWVAFEFASARLSPGTTWGSLAYSVADHAVIAQTASLVGWTGLTFLVVWTASAGNWIWDRRHAEPTARAGATAVAVVIVALLAYGFVRTVPVAGGETTRAACVVAPSTFDAAHIDDVWAYTRGVAVPDASTQRAISRIEASMDEHFALVQRAADDGADLVVWPEASAVVTASEAPVWIERARAVARAEAVAVGMGMMVYRPATGEPSINSFVLVDADGTVAFDFIKATRPPGAGHVKGDGVLPVYDASFGRTSAAICFDLDFPHLIHQAGAARADILLAPSNDWPEVRDTHARMARLRAIEQGLVLVRPTKDGLTLMTDGTGRTIASVAVADGETALVVVDIPVHGRRTLYAHIGDAFAWACVVGFAAACVIAVRRRSASVT